MIPPLESNGLLPQGIHSVEWQEFVERFGSTPHRRRLLAGLKEAIDALVVVGCQQLYVDGSFVTSEAFPKDYDCCWDGQGVDAQLLYLLDPVFFDFSNKRAAQKARYGGEFFPANGRESITGKTFLEFFQTDKETGKPKGIIALNLRSWKS